VSLSVALAFHATGAPLQTVAPEYTSTTESEALGANVSVASKPVTGVRTTAIFSAPVRYPNWSITKKGVVGIACVAAFQGTPTTVVSVAAKSTALEASGVAAAMEASSEASSPWASTLEDGLELEQARRGEQKIIRRGERNLIA
jgi:hypothetical protein